MSGDSIKLSPKHGVNPSILVCFWCEEEIGVALLGKLPKDAEAPEKVSASYYPCDKCKEKFSKGILLFEAIREEGRVIPTGRYMIVSEEAFTKIDETNEIRDKETFDRTMSTKQAAVMPATFESLLLLLNIHTTH